jgi:hypothetical protein
MKNIVNVLRINVNPFMCFNYVDAKTSNKSVKRIAFFINDPKKREFKILNEILNIVISVR